MPGVALGTVIPVAALARCRSSRRPATWSSSMCGAATAEVVWPTVWPAVVVDRRCWRRPGTWFRSKSCRHVLHTWRSAACSTWRCSSCSAWSATSGGGSPRRLNQVWRRGSPRPRRWRSAECHERCDSRGRPRRPPERRQQHHAEVPGHARRRDAAVAQHPPAARRRHRRHRRRRRLRRRDRAPQLPRGHVRRERASSPRPTACIRCG